MAADGQPQTQTEARAGGPPPGEALLEAVEIHKHFGGIQAVAGASIRVPRGAIVGLIGPNGAGKTTLFNLISGFYRPDGGHVFFDGQRIDGLPPHRIIGRGLARTFQIPRELKEMTVLENMMLFPQQQAGERLWRALLRPGQVTDQERRLMERAREALAFVELEHLQHEWAQNLSGGQKKLLELARTLMSDPQLILLDEPGAGVNPTLMRHLSDAILELRRQGRTFLLIEHDMDVITTLCDHVVVMARGAVLAEGTFEEIRADQRVLDAYLTG